MNKENLKRSFRIIKRKKWPIILVCVIIIAAIASPFIYLAVSDHNRYTAKSPIELSSIFVKKTDQSQINLIAHRGFSCQAPENTVAAIEKAGDYGFDTVEIDVRQTSDGVWVVSHNADIKGMTDKSGKISSYTYYDLITANIDNGANHKEYDGLKIATLEQILKTCLEYNIKPMIEIKDYTEDGLDTLLQIIDKNGFTNSCSIISFDRDVLNKVKERNSDIALYVLVSKLNKKNLQACLDDPSIGVSFNGHNSINTEKKIKQLQEAGIPLACWTVDDAETMQKYYDMGVTTFVTNRIYKK
jgi:glycerophosphoryl diester phosphodiesterase